MMRQPKETSAAGSEPATLQYQGEERLQPLSAHVVSDDAPLREALRGLDPANLAGPINFSFSRPSDGIDPLLSPGLDVVLIDIGAGGSKEMGFLKRAIALGPDAPVVAIGNDDASLQIAAIEAGAEDCIECDARALRSLTLAIRRATVRRSAREERCTASVRPVAEPQVTLVQETPEAIVILDSQGNVRFVNGGAEELLGRTASEMLGKPFGLPIEPGEHEVAVIRPDGDNRFAEMRIVDTQWGGVPARVAALNDTTVRRKLERTMQAAEAQSRETLKRSRSFFSNVNHDLRTPLTHIIGFSELMKNEQFGPIGQPRYRDYARDIHSSGAMLLDMIEDLLGIAEAETEELDLTNEICNIGQLVEIAAASQKFLAGKEGVRLEIDCPPRLPGLRGDARRLRQGLFRLISEAIHCARRGATLRLSAREEDGRLVLTVAEDPQKDEIAAQTPLPYALERHDDPFVSSEDSGTAREEGLALSLTRKVMELHGGTLDIGSAAQPMSIMLSFPADRVIR